MHGEEATTVEDRSALDGSPEAALAVDCLLAGIDAARPETVLAETVRVDGSTLIVDGESYDLDVFERVLVLGGGNAAGRMAAALEARLGDRIDDGIVVTDDPVPLDVVESVTGSHPTPDRAALEGTERLLALAEDAGEDDLLLGVVTGGGSALLPAPAGDVTLADLQALTESLVRSGATIDEINAVRKHVSALKGGRLARAAAPATTVATVLSDVVGDDPATVASGPFSPDSTTYEEARAVLDRYDVSVPDSVERLIERGVAGRAPETPGPDDPAFDAVDVHVLASNGTAVEAARAVAERAGYDPLVLSTRIRGEASDVGTVHGGIAAEVAASGRPVEPPAVLLSGGETTVTVGDAEGRGGPNQEFALTSALELSSSCSPFSSASASASDSPEIVVAAVDTDGIDGSTDAAGALLSPDRIAGGNGGRSAARRALDDHDVYPFLEDAGALLRTGPTGTNVNDLRVIVIGDS
ncbi:glycerate kinase [Salinarchaeum chitinilyticum]